MMFRKNVSLKNCTTFKIGGKAKYFLATKTKEDLIKAVVAAKKLRLPFFILGGGSNLLVSDEGYEGLAINFQCPPIFNFLKNKIIVGAGMKLGELINVSANKGLTGLEWAAGIPGTAGGAVFGNAGAFQKSAKDVVEEVEVFDADNKKIKIFKNKDCRFGYRDSIFKKKKNLIILYVVFQLKKGNKREIRQKIKEYLNRKKETQPLSFPSAGSVFKNPPGFFAAELIEGAGLKGKRIGDVQISEKHANFIVNLGRGRSRDVATLINLVKKKVKIKFNVSLKEEIQFVSSA